MKYESLVTIIIPVYNAAEYLSVSIGSILNQTYKNIEIILVNDGSDDNSDIICDKYAEVDSRIRVIHQANCGPSAARNRGINIAKGKYIQFVDSDDSIEPNMTHRLVESMNNTTQLALCGYKSIEEKNGNKTNIKNKIPSLHGNYKMNDFIKYFIEFFNENLINSPCNKLYVSKLLHNENIRFKENFHMGEDLLFNLIYFKHCKKISIISAPLYNYITSNNNDSLTGNFIQDFFETQQILFLNVRKFLMDHNSYKGNHKDFLEVSYTNSIIGCLSNLFHKNSYLTLKDRKEEIYKIIYDETVNNNIKYFSEGNIQKVLIGYLIKNKSLLSIYFFLKIKSIIKMKTGPFFTLAKIMNAKLISKR